MKSASRLAILALVAAFSAATVPTTASAANIFQDFFSYPDGALVGNALWKAHSGALAKPVQVAGGMVTVQQSAGSGEDINHAFTQQLGTAKTYAAFNLTVTGTIGTANDYFFHFRPAGSDSNNFVTRTYIGPPTAGGDYTLGVAAGSLTTTPLAPWGSGMVLGQNYRVVVAYDGVTGTSTLWVDPTNEASTSVSSTSAPLAGRLLASVALRQASPTGATHSEQIDQLYVRSPFDVPSASQWSLMVLAGLMLVGGAAFMLRRRAIA